MARFSIRYLNYDLELPQGPFTIGRSPDCQLALDDPLISRRHATLHVSEKEVTFEDLGSRNGSTVNGDHVKGKRLLRPGDRVGIGSQEIVLIRLADPRTGAKTIAPCGKCGGNLGLDDRICPKCGAAIATTTTRRIVHDTILKTADPETRQTSAFRLLAGVAEKALAMGRVDEGERILGNLLRDFKNDLEHGKQPEGDSLEDAARFALRLAEASGKPTWIDWLFETYREAGVLLPGATIDALHALVRRARYPAGETLRAYVEAMRALSGTMTPAERFLLKRLEGLREVAASQ